MKRSFVFRGVKPVFVVLICAALFAACNRNEAPAPGAMDSDTSYAFGMLVASQMGLTEFSFDYYAFMEGFRDFNENRETRLTQDAAMELIMTAITMVDEQGQANLEEGRAYLAQNAQRAGVITTASGLQYEVLVQGTGATPGAHDTVRVHYEGTFLDGTVFDSSFARGEPTEFPVGMVIQGWVEGLQLMNVGSTFRFVIPADLAYGTHGMPPTIPPNATLIFRVELIDIL